MRFKQELKLKQLKFDCECEIHSCTPYHVSEMNLTIVEHFVAQHMEKSKHTNCNEKTLKKSCDACLKLKKRIMKQQQKAIVLKEQTCQDKPAIVAIGKQAHQTCART